MSAATTPQAPSPDKATVVFLRPAFTGYAITAAVYEDDRFAGIVMRNARLTVELSPGQHRFMVISEAADFLDADVEAGKEYFVKVAPRMGVWRARFSLYPITPTGGEWKDLPEWLADSYPVAVNAEGEEWARENASSVREKHDSYLPEWLERTDRPALRPQDGVQTGTLAVR